MPKLNLQFHLDVAKQDKSSSCLHHILVPQHIAQAQLKFRAHIFHHVRLATMVERHNTHDDVQGNRQFTSALNTAAEDHAHIRWRRYGLPR